MHEVGDATLQIRVSAQVINLGVEGVVGTVVCAGTLAHLSIPRQFDLGRGDLGQFSAPAGPGDFRIVHRHRQSSS